MPFQTARYSNWFAPPERCSILNSGSIATEYSSADLHRPEFDRVAAARVVYFSTLKDYKPNDLISQSLVSDALAHVTDVISWQIPEQKLIADRALADKLCMVTQLSTPKRNIGGTLEVTDDSIASAPSPAVGN